MPTDDTKPNPPGVLRFSRWYVHQTLKNKKIIAVELNDPSQEIDELGRFRDQKKLDFISNEIARREFTHDTSSIFKIEFGRRCTYGDFVWMLNLTRLYDVKRFVFIDDAYYLFTTPPPPPEQPIQDLKLYLGNDVIVESKPALEKEPSWWEVFKTELGEWWEKAILIVERSFIYVLGFLLLILIPTVVGLRKQGSWLTPSSNHHS